MALRTSSANVDPFKDDLTCELNSYTLIEQLFAMQNIRGALGNGAYLLNKEGAKKHFFSAPVNNLKVIETFTLDYRVKWPLTLIISRRAITKYQLIFRHLFFCKYVEKSLANTWLLH